ncbi:MAG: type IV pilus modification protein PilV [Endozoicomonadaceae bacterium]|nr:type IV pilus modification protein PilV [Endozoicomonadaceae bacterium]
MQTNNTNRCTLSKQHGFNLIESMVTLFILTIGILGVAGLQSISIVSHKDSYHTSQAMLLAQNMAERVRANKENVALYHQHGQSAGSFESQCFTTSGCSTEQMVRTDLHEWQQSVSNLLPSGQGIICQSSSVPSAFDLVGSDLRTQIISSCGGSGETFVIHVFWDRNRDGEVRLQAAGGTGNTLDTRESDGYLQLIFTP